MSKLETNIKHIQRFIDQCITKGVSSYIYSFSVKREILNAEQANAATEKELLEFSDELMLLLRQNPILRYLVNYIEVPDFLWESAFIESLTTNEKRKYAGFKVSSLDMEAYTANPSLYDVELPYFSAVINYGLLMGYINYLKRLAAVDSPKETEAVEPVVSEGVSQSATVIYPQDFESNFDKRQIEILTKCLNELRIFTSAITAKMMKDILWCKLKEPLKIAKGKNKLLAYFFSSLDNRSLISREWQSICAKNKLFLSSGQGLPMQQGNFSSAVAQNNEFPPKDCHIIDNYIKQLKAD